MGSRQEVLGGRSEASGVLTMEGTAVLAARTPGCVWGTAPGPSTTGGGKVPGCFDSGSHTEDTAPGWLWDEGRWQPQWVLRVQTQGLLLGSQLGSPTWPTVL